MKILIVDDSPTSRRLVISALRGLGFNDFDNASDGFEALDKLRNDHFDMLITDWNMPNLNGLELTKLVRKDPVISKLPIIIITTRGEKDDLIDALKNHVDNYIVKPFTQKILKEKIDQVLDKYNILDLHKESPSYNPDENKINTIENNKNSNSELLSIDSIVNLFGKKNINEIRNNFKFIDNNYPLEKSSITFQNIPKDFNFVIKINYCLGKIKTTSTLLDIAGNIIAQHEFE